MKSTKYTGMIGLLFFLSCQMTDERTAIAKKGFENHVEEQSENFPVTLLNFQKINGEDYEGAILFSPGVHKLYRLSYRATYRSKIDCYLLVERSDESAFPQMFIYGSNETPPGLYVDYYKREIKVDDTFSCTGDIHLKQTENGWEVYTYY